jgi:hypothetical protein
MSTTTKQNKIAINTIDSFKTVGQLVDHLTCATASVQWGGLYNKLHVAAISVCIGVNK